ncbi:homocysteine S-methyltransferase family protein [candidate division KSB1 bacterium]|nr:homocysteine S-methyltransferase family protein [candidate division KSB1 bacterium]
MTKSLIKKIIDKNDLILMEGAVVEILRRSGKVNFHPDLIHTHLIYDKNGVNELISIFKSYLDIANKTDSPFIICAPTWRANKDNVFKSGINKNLNIDAVKFMFELRSDYPDLMDKIMIGGIIGPKNDCYQPNEGLTSHEAEEFHSWQIDQLKTGGVDFIIAETMPNINEALGIANACSKQNIDYIISFVISRSGKILDQTELLDAIQLIDNSVNNIPIGYSVNCAHPSFLCADKQPKKLFDRFIGYLGNASDLDHCDLDNADKLHTDDIIIWGNEMLRLNQEFGIKILGGCCGTDANHIDYLRKRKNTHHNTL